MYNDYFWPFIHLFEMMAPYLLLGFLIAGILHAFVPRSLYNQWLGKKDFRSVLLSILIGVPLPLCSCGVIPTAVSMRKEGASQGAVTAFLISTPQTGVDSIIATYSVLGLPFAILRPIVAIITGMAGGALTNIATQKEKDATQEILFSDELPTNSFKEKCLSAFHYGFSYMIQDIGKWLIVGLITAGLITIFVPEGFFTSHLNNPLISTVLVLIAAIPMYVCATGSIPIVAALMLKGLTPGMGLIFLMAGPATNIASILVLSKSLSKKTVIIYLASIIIGAIVFGLAVDYLLPHEWFTLAMHDSLQPSCCHMTPSASWIEIVSSLLLGILLIRAMYLRFTQKELLNVTDMKKYKITGMMCNHCKSHVLAGISGLKGVESVEVDLATGIASVQGNVSSDEVIRTVKSLGYECELI